MSRISMVILLLLLSTVISCTHVNGGGTTAQVSQFGFGPPVAPRIVLNQPYMATLKVTGGTAPYTIILASGSLPTGLVFNGETGTITGTPIKLEKRKCHFLATDSSPTPIEVDLVWKMTVQGITVGPNILPDPKIGEPYRVALQVYGGVAPFDFMVVSGSLPDGLTIDTRTGEISGTASREERATFAIKVFGRAGYNETARGEWSLHVVERARGVLGISPELLVPGNVEWPFCQPLTVTGGTPPYKFSLIKGVLPLGLVLDQEQGTIKGIPESVYGDYCRIRVTDSSQPSLWGETPCRSEIGQVLSTSAPTSRSYRVFFMYHMLGNGMLYTGGLAETLFNNNYFFRGMYIGQGYVPTKIPFVIGNCNAPYQLPICFNTKKFFKVMKNWKLGPGESHDIMMFLPDSQHADIASNAQLADYKAYYMSMLDTFAQNPGIVFMPVTIGPLPGIATTRKKAGRAREFAEWLKFEYAQRLPNLVTFDLFSVLAYPADHGQWPNTLREEYGTCNSIFPNQAGNKAAALAGQDFINAALRHLGKEL